jgi:hypothetical protein
MLSRYFRWRISQRPASIRTGLTPDVARGCVGRGGRPPAARRPSVTSLTESFSQIPVLARTSDTALSLIHLALGLALEVILSKCAPHPLPPPLIPW